MSARGQKACIKIAAIILTVFCGFTSFASQSLAEPVVAGRWITNYGKVQIHQAQPNKIVGTYFYQGLPAHIYGTTQNGFIYEGIWIQGTSEKRCKNKALTSPYWGRFRFIFIGKKFYGLWNYCSERLIKKANHQWKGILKVTFDAWPTSTTAGSKQPAPSEGDAFDQLQSQSEHTESEILKEFDPDN